jgi:hypothetical protein
MPPSRDDVPSLGRVWRSLASPHPAGFLAARWVFLRGLGICFFSAFYSYAYQIQGLIGPNGILPARHYLDAAREYLPTAARFLEVPTLFWAIGTTGGAQNTVVALGLLASTSIIINLAPRTAILVSVACFLSIISVSSVFASYQSDGMLLEAGFLSLFFAPGGVRPRLGRAAPPSRIARFLLVWEWFRIYFESGVVKVASGDPQWRDLTALDHYYENCPLPTVIGWYTQHLPHPFHAAMTVVTLAMELFLVWAALAPRLWRVALFFVVSLFQVGIILTANYAFLNYLVLFLGVLLVDDATVRRWIAGVRRWYRRLLLVERRAPRPLWVALRRVQQPALRVLRALSTTLRAVRVPQRQKQWKAVVLSFLFYTTLLEFPVLGLSGLPALLTWPARVLEPFRFANAYGLFAVMTRERFEIEFQGTLDGERYVPYPFRYKPQDVTKAPGIYAPYQPRFEWNLWFAALGSIQRNAWVRSTARALLRSEPAVLRLFAFNPFAGHHPKAVRTVIYRYTITDWREFKTRGRYWNRELLGAYAPTVGVGDE